MFIRSLQKHTRTVYASIRWLRELFGGYSQRVHREATAGCFLAYIPSRVKLAQAGEGGGARQVARYAPAEWAAMHTNPVSSLEKYVLCGYNC